MLQKSNICQYRPLTFFENNAIFSQNPSSCNRATIFYTLTNRKARFSSNHPGNGNERFARTKMQSNTNIGTQIATSAKQKKAKKESPEFRAITRHSGLFLAESKGFEPSNTRLDVTRFPIVLLRPARTTLHIQRAQGASAYSLLIQNLVVRGELIQLFLKLILGLLLRGGDGIMAGEATVAKIESGLLRKFVSRFYTKIPQAVNP